MNSAISPPTRVIVITAIAIGIGVVAAFVAWRCSR